MNITHLEALVHADADMDLVNHEQDQSKQRPVSSSQLDDVLPESYERTYIPDGELQLPVRVVPQPRNPRRPFPMVTVVATDGNQHSLSPIGTNGIKQLGVRRRTVSAPTRGAAKAANAGRATMSRKTSLVVLTPETARKRNHADGEHPPLSNGAAHNTPRKSSPTKDTEEASISSGPRLTITIPAMKKKGDTSKAKENPSDIEVSGAKKTNKKATKIPAREKLEASKVQEAGVSPAGGSKRKELHENNRGAGKGANKRAKKNDAKLVEDKPKIILRLPGRTTPVTDLETAARNDEAAGSKTEREGIRDRVDEPKLRRGSRQKVPSWKMRPQ
ncbi:hypothetical protein CCMSSC00406_0009221 [Pleurotus cornucopiae]|uniref:Uncharacterized protein n=1 Tax=Pleurotus cornucopiae TaxID=5321 RepID=A0ACB7J0Q1_PLECO|nr:hypothetical protein CCMSSC00406_0009221 [Pleurotus cornucopiae]